MKEEMEERRVQDRDEYTKELEKERKEFETYKKETKEQMQKHNEETEQMQKQNEETEQKLREIREELSRTNGRVAESTIEAKHDSAILLGYVDGVVYNFRRLKDTG